MPELRLGLPCGIFIVFVGILLLKPVTGVIVQFCDCNNTVLSTYRSSHPTCVSLPDWKPTQACQIKRLGFHTSCITLFWKKDCSVSSGLEVIISSKIDHYLFPDYLSPKSFRLCTQLEMERQNFVDTRGIIQSINQFAQYSKTCGCANLPLFRQDPQPLPAGRNDSVCVRLYFEEDCSGIHLEAFVGAVAESELPLNANTFRTIVPQIRSVRRCKPTPGCAKRLDGIVTKIEIIARPTKSQLEAATDQLEMGSNTRFQNNGSATLIQEYAVKRVITESKRVEVAKSLATVHHVGVSASVTADVNFGMLFAKAKIKGALSAAYDWTRNETDETRNQLLLTSQKEFSVMKRIEIPLCTEYSVTSYIKVLDNMAIDYTIFTELRGSYEDRWMSAGELQREIGNMQLVRIADNFTIIVKENASMTLSMGIESVMDGRGTKIDGCQNHLTTSIPVTVAPVVVVRVTSGATGNACVRVVIQALVILHAFLAF